MNYLYLIISGILFGGIVFGGKVLSNMGASLFEIMLYPNIIPAVLLFYFARKDLHKLFMLPLSFSLLLIAAMFFITVGQYAPLFFHIPVTLVVLLLYLQPVWTILIDKFYYHHQTSRREWLLVVSMIIGLVVLINPFADVSFAAGGVILALLGGLGISVWVFTTKFLTAQDVSPWGTFWICCVYSAIPVVMLYAGLNEYGYGNSPLAAFSATISPKLWAAFLFYSMVIVALPNLLVFYHNKTVPAPQIGMILLLEPLTGIILDVIFLNMQLTWNIVLGGLIILIANLIMIFQPQAAKINLEKQEIK